ncbi:MAG TPA: hypothetical protein VGB44_09290 [Flavobacterium sp.]|jgi:hypothetical protein
MKKFLICIFALVAFTSSAQKKAEIKEFFWGANDAFAKATEIPAKWSGESAVIIFKNDYYNFHKFGKSVTYTSAVRKRIKLQDAPAVKEYSEFSFNEKFRSNKGYSTTKGVTTVGIKIVKPDGKEIEIDVDKEAKAIDEGKKIAISGLEAGDIIDYYYYTVEEFKSQYDVSFEPTENTLSDVYPVMEVKLQFETENDFFINFATYNGAPELKETYSKGSERKYELVAKDLEKNDFPRWFYPLVELPTYKFQVVFARSAKFEEGAAAFLSEKESIVKKSVTKEDIFGYYNKKFTANSNIDGVEDFIKGKSFASDEEKVREVYYYARHMYFTKFFEAAVAQDAKIMLYPFVLYPEIYSLDSEQQFINRFMGFLKKNKIDYDVIIGTERVNGPIKDLLIENNVTLLLRVNTQNPIYLQYYSPFTSADQFNFKLEGTDAYALQISKGKKVVDAESTLLPSTTDKDNISKNVVELKLDDDFSGLKVNREISYFGHFKDEEQSDKLQFYDYVHEDYRRYGTKSLIERVKKKKDREQYTKEMDAVINKLKDRQKENLKKQASDEYGFELADYAYEIKNTGRFGSKTPFTVTENFSIQNNLVKRAGENYLVEIGKMLTSQVEIEKKEKERKNNVYLPYPRSFENEIIFEIPAGYTVSGLEKLNKKVTNSTGGFTSSSRIEGNKLIVNTVKYYSNYYEPNSNWNKMIDFLDAAYQFTQEKVLLKKV